MKTAVIALCLGALSVMSAPADAQKPMRVRGTITAVDGNTISLKSLDGKDLKVQMTEKTVVVAAKALKLEDLKAGDYVGSTSKAGPDGKLVASEVHTIARTVKEGHGPWDMGPGTLMTNANVGSVVKAANGHELTLNYSGGSQTITVPPGTPIVTNVPADRSLVKAGTYVFIGAQVDPDGTITAGRIQAEKDGVKPPQ
jgi:hypothetical protein